MRFAPAVVEDANAIVGIIHQSPSILLPYTPLGCEGADAFVRDTIQYQGPSTDRIWMGAYAPELVAVAEIRILPARLFLNQIYVASGIQGRGVGGQLLAAAIDLCSFSGATHLELDVIADNDRALHWYERLGLVTIGAADWSLEPQTRDAEGWFVYHDLPSADIIHRRYSFSTFSITTMSGSHRVGRLGDRFYRITDALVVSDPAAHCAMHVLDPDRQLLLIGSRSLQAPSAVGSFATTLRMQGPLSFARDRLRDFPL